MIANLTKSTNRKEKSMSDKTLYGLKEDAVDNFKDYVLGLNLQDLLDFCQQDEPHDIISEMADGSCPVYTSEILEVAACNIELATEPSEIRQDGTPIEIITDNIYSALTQACHEWFNDNKDEIKEECQDITEALESFQDSINNDPALDDDDAAVYKLVETLSDEYSGEEDRDSVVDYDKTVDEIIFDVLNSWYDKQTEKEKRK